MNPLLQTYLPYSIKKIYFSQELYIIFWKLFELNHKFLVHMLRSSSLFDLVVPLLFQLLQTRTNPGLYSMCHIHTYVQTIIVLYVVYCYVVNRNVYYPNCTLLSCSSSGHATCRCVHSSPALWREKLRSEIKQAVYTENTFS